jgi:hypothetical protein
MRDYTYAVFIQGSSEGMKRLAFQVRATSLRDATILAQAELINQGLSDEGLRLMKID